MITFLTAIPAQAPAVLGVEAIVAITGVFLTFMITWSTVMFKVGKQTAAINQNSAILIDVRNIVTNQDKRIDRHDRRILVIETHLGITPPEDDN